MDQITLDRIKLMHPNVREQLKEEYIQINNQLPKGIRLRLTHTLRTNKEQSDLYAQGRTKPGSIVTNSKAGQSLHNYGLAFDIVILHDEDGNGTFEKASWAQDKYFMQVVRFFKLQGWQWGGDWKKFKDAPHFQTRHTWQELAELPKFKDGNNEYPVIS